MFLPFALAGDTPGYEILHPLALVVIGGVITATLVNLFVTPGLYLHFGLIPAQEHSVLPASHEPSMSAAD
ncbi:MAG: efflux RND transporter permease subunit [Caldilineaceae bacterium]